MSPEERQVLAQMISDQLWNRLYLAQKEFYIHFGRLLTLQQVALVMQESLNRSIGKEVAAPRINANELRELISVTVWVVGTILEDLEIG